MFPFFVFYCNFTKKVIFCKAYIVLLDNTKIILYNFVILKNTKNYKMIPMSQEEKFLECLAKATKGKKDLSNFEVLEFAFSIFCCLDNYIQNNKARDKKILKLLKGDEK